MNSELQRPHLAHINGACVSALPERILPVFHPPQGLGQDVVHQPPWELGLDERYSPKILQGFHLPQGLDQDAVQHPPRGLGLDEHGSVLPGRILQGLHPPQSLGQDVAHHLPQELGLDELPQPLHYLGLQEVLRPQARPDYPAVVGGSALQQHHPVFAVTKIWLILD